jgi:hypothetical protein
MKIHSSVRWFAAATVLLILLVVLAHGQHILIPLGIFLGFIFAGLCAIGGLLHLMFS